MIKNLFMLVGVPGSGKSTWLKNQFDAGVMSPDNTVVVSTDDILEHFARTCGITYNEAFPDFIESATKLATLVAKTAFAHNKNVVWDQTNTSIKTRAKKLAMVPEDYYWIAVYFPTPDVEEHTKRLNRPGKVIPASAIEAMINSLEKPTVDEGFDCVYDIAGAMITFQIPKPEEIA